MKLSEIVRNYRLEHDLSQREFAKRCGVTNSYISFIENECNPKTGRPMTPTIEQYKKLADGMSISVQELFQSLDKDAPVILNVLNSPLNYPLLNEDGGITEETPDQAPVTREAQILARGTDKLSQEERERLLTVVRAMFPMQQEFFRDNDKEE